MIQLGDKEWAQVVKDVLVVLQRITSTRDDKRRWTQADKAREAVQDAFDRLLRTNPPDLDTVDAVRRYLVRAARSALSHAHDAAQVRAKTAEEAGIEEAATMRTEAPSAETMNLEAAERAEERSRDARWQAEMERELEDAGDTFGLTVFRHMMQGIEEPAALAAKLRCPVEKIHNARKRRSLIAQKIRAAERARQDDDEDGA